MDLGGPVPIGLRSREHEFAEAYLKTADVELAARAIGVNKSARWIGNALLKRPRVIALVGAAQTARRLRLNIDADFVLLELCRQLARLYAMQGHDIAELYDDNGGIKPVAAWPPHWRTGLIAEIHTQETYDYSHDGKIAGDSKTWDVSGKVTRIQRQSALAIEKEIRATIAEIGRHTNVKAFPTPERHADTMNVLVVTAEKARQVVAARKRLAEEI
jgi:phage terminase small subunit